MLNSISKGLLSDKNVDDDEDSDDDVNTDEDIYKDFMPEDYSTAEAKTRLFYITQSSKIWLMKTHAKLLLFLNPLIIYQGSNRTKYKCRALSKFLLPPPVVIFHSQIVNHIGHQS
jgi:hypothetical protein